MFLAVGLGALTGSAVAYAAGIFHLVGHAFFKALLFLGAGSVMHATGGVTDMKKMGGLRAALPTTSAVFLIAWLAIIGAPPLVGFFSKDAVLAVTWEAGRPALWAVGVGVALITAFYMSRQVFLVFFGGSQLPVGVRPHESPSTMTWPMSVLAALSIGGGLLGLSVHSGGITRFLEPIFGGGRVEGPARAAFAVPEAVLAVVALLAAAAGVGIAWRLYLAGDAAERRASIKGSWAWAVSLLRGSFHVDEFYGAAVVWPARTLSEVAAFGFDLRIIDGAVDGVARLVGVASGRLRRLQSGLVRRYAVAMLTGIVAVVALLVVRLR
jgi:NADH-quinone oxidoreductase subunit L